jgi:hypothetical protein
MAGATLNGQLNPNGNDSSYQFELSTNPTFGSFTPLPAAVVDLGAGIAGIAVDANATGLTAGTVYYYRLVASNVRGSATSSPAEQFTTLAASTTMAAPVAAPANIAPPAISGTLKAGEKLACSPRSWSNDPTMFTYQWSFDGTPIQGATTDIYAVQSGDEASRSPAP